MTALIAIYFPLYDYEKYVCEFRNIQLQAMTFYKCVLMNECIKVKYNNLCSPSNF